MKFHTVLKWWLKFQDWMIGEISKHGNSSCEISRCDEQCVCWIWLVNEVHIVANDPWTNLMGATSIHKLKTQLHLQLYFDFCNFENSLSRQSFSLSRDSLRVCHILTALLDQPLEIQCSTAILSSITLYFG